MNKKLGLLLVVVLVIITACTLAACNFGGNSGTNTRPQLVEDIGYADGLLIYCPYDASSRAVTINDFDISEVKARVRYKKTVYDEYGDPINYYYDDKNTFSLTESMVQNPECLTDLQALRESRNQIYVEYKSKDYLDEDGYEVLLEGVFTLYLKANEIKEYVTITFDLNGGTASFAGQPTPDGEYQVKVEKGSRFTWPEFISRFPIAAPVGSALDNWGTFGPTSSTLVINSDISLSANFTNSYLTVRFDLNNTSTEYTVAPKTPDPQNVAIGSGFLVRPSTSEIDTFTGYDFVGWYKDKAGTEVWNFTVDLRANGKSDSSDFTLYAKWVERQFTLQFNLMDGSLSSTYLQAAINNVAASGEKVPEIAKINADVAGYLTYTSNTGTVEYIETSPYEKAGARKMTFDTNRRFINNSNVSAGDYYFEYNGLRYYFSLSSSKAPSEKGFQIGLLPTILRYPGLKVGDKYFSQSGTASGSIMLSLGESFINSSKLIYKGQASELGIDGDPVYYFEFKGWYTSETFDVGTEFIFENSNHTSKEVNYADFVGSTSDYTLTLYAKWEVTHGTSTEKYFSDYLYKNNVALKSDGTISITGIGDKTVSIVPIPKTIRYNFGDGDVVYTVSEIGAGAFKGISKLIEIQFEEGNSITTIGDEAFAFSTNLTAINLDELTLINKIGIDVLKNTRFLNNYKAAGNDFLVLNNILVQYTGSNLVSEIDMTESKYETILNGVDVIGANAFASIPTLLKIKISKEIKVIEDNAFKNDTALVVVDFEDGTLIESVGPNAFYKTRWVNGSNFRRATSFDPNKDYYTLSVDVGFIHNPNDIPESQEDIDKGKYYEEIEIENKKSNLILGSIFYRYTGSTKKEDATAFIPSENDGFTITRIAAEAFAGYENIKVIEFEDSSVIEDIGANAFSDTAFVSIGTQNADDITDSTYVSKDGFTVINNILVCYSGPATSSNSAVTIPNNVEYISDSAFSRYDGIYIKNILIQAGSQLKAINDYAFKGATSLQGISFIDSTIAENVIISDKSFNVTNTAVNKNLSVYFTMPEGYSFNAYIENLKINSTSKNEWNYYYAELGAEKFKELRVQNIVINDSCGIASKYLITDESSNHQIDLYAIWEATKDADGNSIINTTTSGYNYISNGLKITRTDGVSTTQDLFIDDNTTDHENLISIYSKADNSVHSGYVFSASEISSEKTYGEYTIKFTIDGVEYIDPSNVYDIYIYPGIDPSTITIHGLQDRYYTSQTTLPKSGDEFYVEFDLYNGKTDRFRLDNQQFTYEADDIHAQWLRISNPNYTSSKGENKTMTFVMTYNGFVSHQYSKSVQYSSVVAEVESFAQSSPFLFAINSNASNYYSNCFFDLIYQDGNTRKIAMSGSFNITAVYYVDSANPENSGYVPATAFDTSSLGLHNAKISYNALPEITIMYTVYLGTNPDVFTYDFGVVGGENVAKITGLRTTTFDSTLMIPSVVVRSSAIDSLNPDYQTYRITEIADSAFEGQTRLQGIYLANTITKIGDYAFKNCTNLKNVYTFEIAEDKTTPIINSDPDFDYYAGPDGANNILEPTEEMASYYARVYISEINYQGMDAIVVPYTLTGPSGYETVTSKLPMQDSATGYYIRDGLDVQYYSYRVPYSYILSPIIPYSTEGDEFISILNNETEFYGNIYVPDIEYYHGLEIALEEAYGVRESDGKADVNFTLVFYTKGDPNVPISTSDKFTYKGNTDTTSRFLTRLTYDIDMIYRSGEVAILENARFPIAEDGSVYIPASYSGSYTIQIDEVDVPVYYDYSLTTVMDGCLYNACYDGMTSVYMPYAIYNIWSNIDNILLFAQNIEAYKAAHPTLTNEQIIANRISANNSATNTLAIFQYESDSTAGYTVNYDENGAIISVESDHIVPDAYKVANYFSSSVKFIGKEAFMGCTSLVTIDFTKAVALEEIDSAAFKGCTSLLAIDLSKTMLDEIEASTFEDCTALAEVTLSNRIAVYGRYAFTNNNFDSAHFIITQDIEKASASIFVCDYAFYNVKDAGDFIPGILTNAYGNVSYEGADAFSN